MAAKQNELRGKIMDKMLIGEVTGVHGIRGELKIRPLTDDPGRYYELDVLTLRLKGKETTYPIELVRLHKGNVLLTLKGIRDRDMAEDCKGAEVLIDRDEAVDLEEDEFFITDLIGMTVKAPDGQTIGRVGNILQTTGSVDTVEINGPDKPIYVPFRKIYFISFDFENGEIQADIPVELMEL